MISVPKAFVFLMIVFAFLPRDGQAQGAQSPYDTLYRVTEDTHLRSAPEQGSAIKGQLARGIEGVVMRWCRPEFNFRDWAYGSLSKRRQMLRTRLCEVQINGVIGFVDSRHLDPM